MSLHQQINEDNVHERESAAERLQSRWISSSRAIVDRPPSQPPSPRRMSRRPSSVSVEESQHKDPRTGDSQEGSHNERLQCSDSKWTSGSGVITDSPPSKPPSHRGVAVERLELGGSRWNSGSQADFGTASSPALGCHRMKFEHSAAIKKHDTFDTPFWNLSRRDLSQTASGCESGMRCTTSRSA
jgi:hypothetical protein